MDVAAATQGILAEIIAGAGPGGAPTVSVVNGSDAKLLRSFLAYDPAFTGGVRVGTVPAGLGQSDLLTGPGPGIGPSLRRFRATDAQSLDDFFPRPTYRPVKSPG